MVTFARVSKVGIIPTCPRRSEWYLSRSLEIKTQFDSQTDAGKIPADYSVNIIDPSQILKSKEGHGDYSDITTTNLKLLTSDIYKGLKINGREVKIEVSVKATVYG